MASRYEQITRATLNSRAEQARSGAAEMIVMLSASLGPYETGSCQLGGEAILARIAEAIEDDAATLEEDTMATLAYVGLLTLLNEGTIEMVFPPDKEEN